MLNNLLFYFQLALLCLKLAFKLILFSIIFLIKKANKKRVVEGFLIVSIVLIWALNLYIIRQKNTTITNLEKTKAVDNLDQEFILSKKILKEDDLKAELETYQKIEGKNINSLGLYLNIAEINKALKNKDLSKEYFNKAQKIEPKIKYLEN